MVGDTSGATAGFAPTVFNVLAATVPEDPDFTFVSAEQHRNEQNMKYNAARIRVADMTLEGGLMFSEK